MNLPSLPSDVLLAEPVQPDPRLRQWVRGTLLAVAVGLVAVFTIACWLNPYHEDGTPRTMATHQLMGLPPCTFYATTGLPCPSCGMTTSFALLMHGDPISSLKANAAGTMLALWCLLFIPWGVVSAVRGRSLWIRSPERALTRFLLVLVVVMFFRWVIVLGLCWRNGGP
jgi:hypothetical protein